MIQTYAHQKELHEARIDIKTLERLFANVITEGTNCSPFESDIIVEKAKEVFAIGDYNLKTSYIVGVSVAAVNTYLSLHTKACEDPAYRERISEIEQRGLIYYKNVDF